MSSRIAAGRTAASRMSRRIAAGWIAAGFLLAACQGTGGTPSPAASSATCPGGPAPMLVAATTTVFADMIQQVGGGCVRAISIVPRGGDVHTYEPRPDDLRSVAAARLLVMNGLGLDDWLEKTITNVSAAGTPLLKLGVGVQNVELLPGEGPGTQNPHLFMDVVYAARYVDEIEAGLEQVDGTHASLYRQGADAYRARLAQLDAYVRAEVARIPEANRRIVTFHDAFPYYAREYGITIVGVAVEAPGQDPSAAYTAQLIAAIRAAGVKAIFSEHQFPTKLVDQLAAETGARVVADLYDDSLGEPPVDSYVGVITWDTEQLVQALR